MLPVSSASFTKDIEMQIETRSISARLDAPQTQQQYRSHTQQ
jgi:hypothetical protein